MYRRRAGESGLDFLPADVVICNRSGGICHEEKHGGVSPASAANFREVVTLFVESCYRRGTLYEVLNESGVLLPVDAQEPEEDMMEILMPLMARDKEGVETHPN